MNMIKYLTLGLLCVTLMVGGNILQTVAAQSNNGIKDRPGQTVDDSSGTTSQIKNPLLAKEQAGSTEVAGDAPDEIIERARALIAQANETFIVPGWLNIVSVRERYPTTAPLLSDGRPAPITSINDAWYLLGQGGAVIQAVIVEDTGDVATSQTVIYKNKIWTNLTVPASGSMTEEDYHITTLDQGLLEPSQPENHAYTIEEIRSSDGSENVIVITDRDTFTTPILVEQSLQISGVISKFTLSAETGRIIMVESFLVLLDGTERLWDRIATTVLANAHTAPDKITDLLREQAK